jgi:transcription initiation factor TFIIIB Brf1 subunit/transcription initiation factor TFIIB
MITKTPTTMKKESVEREVPKIEIIYLNSTELNELKSKRKFAEHILENSLDSIKEAINKKWDKVELYNVVNLSILIELKRNNFSKVLKRISKLYEKREEFEICAKIHKLIDKI